MGRGVFVSGTTGFWQADSSRGRRALHGPWTRVVLHDARARRARGLVEGARRCKGKGTARSWRDVKLAAERRARFTDSPRGLPEFQVDGLTGQLRSHTRFPRNSASTRRRAIVIRRSLVRSHVAEARDDCGAGGPGCCHGGCLSLPVQN